MAPLHSWNYSSNNVDYCLKCALLDKQRAESNLYSVIQSVRTGAFTGFSSEEGDTTFCALSAMIPTMRTTCLMSNHK